MAKVHAHHIVSNHQWSENMWLLWIMTRLDRPAVLLNLGSLWDPIVYGPHTPQGTQYCENCKRYLENWRDGYMKEEIERMKNLSSFL